MNYTTLLNQIINESGMTLKEITQKCKEAGEDITSNYLSVLKTVEGKTASDKISHIIAKVCNAKYENILIVQAYIDKAPKPIMDFFNYAKSTTEAEALLFLEQQKDQMQEYYYKKMIQEKKEKFQNQTLSEFICEIISDMSLPTIDGFNEQIELLKKATNEYPNNGNIYAIIPIDKEKNIRYITEEEMNKLTSENK